MPRQSRGAHGGACGFGRGHARGARYRNVHQIKTEPELEYQYEETEDFGLHDSLYVCTVARESHEKVNGTIGAVSKWSETLKIKEKPVDVMLDTGAMCNILSRNTLQQLDVAGAPIKPSSAMLKAFGGTRLDTMGQVTLPVTHKGIQQNVTFEIMRNVPDIIGAVD